jgi:hypothetical protein
MGALAIDVSQAVPKFPWLHDSPDLAVPPMGFICDPYSLEDDNILSYDRYATGYFKGTVNGAGDPILFAEQTRTLFSDGSGSAANANTGKENAQGVALALDESDTNTFDDGSLVPNTSEWFLVRSMGCSLGQVGIFGSDGFVVDPHQEFYEERINAALMKLITLQMSYENTKTQNDLGRAMQWPSPFQAAGATDKVTISTPMVGALQPFALPWLAGSKCNCNRINIIAKLNGGLHVNNDGNSPTVAGEILLGQLTVDLMGQVVCVAAIRDQLRSSGLLKSNTRLAAALREDD